MENTINNNFENELVIIENNKQFIRVQAKCQLKFDEDLINNTLVYLDTLLDTYYNNFVLNNTCTIEIHFDLTSISPYETYKFSKKIYPFFKERTEKTQQFVTKTYILTKSKLIKIMINSLLKLQKLYRPVLMVSSWEDIN
jgi:hypothetical protein